MNITEKKIAVFVLTRKSLLFLYIFFNIYLDKKNKQPKWKYIRTFAKLIVCPAAFFI